MSGRCKVRAEGSAQARTLPREAVETAARWRARAEAANLSIRDLVIEMTGRQSFIGSPQTVAEAIDAHVHAGVCDGFILIRTSRRAALTDLPTRSCRCCRNAACSGLTTRVRRCAITSDSPAAPQPARA